MITNTIRRVKISNKTHSCANIDKDSLDVLGVEPSGVQCFEESKSFGG